MPSQLPPDQSQQQPAQQPQAKSFEQDPSKHPGSNLPPAAQVALSRPVPGQSLTHAVGQMPWQHPPQFTKLEEALNFIMDQVTEPLHLKEMFRLFDLGISVDEMTRVIIFAGFTTGKFTPDLGIMLYKPLLLGIMAIAHRAGMKDTRVLQPHKMQDSNQLQRVKMLAAYKKQKGDVPDIEDEEQSPPPSTGFMNRGQ